MSIFSYVGVAKSLKKRKARVDTTVFQLHYRLTTTLFLVCSLLVSAAEFIGPPIQCETVSKVVKKNLMNSFCYIMSTFSLPTHWNKTLGVGAAYPGLGTHQSHNEEEYYHSYYLWVPFMLFFQAVLFYLPHYMWKCVGGHVYRTLITGLDHAPIDPNARHKKYKFLTTYLKENIGSHQLWAFRFFFCEILCLVNVIGNFYFLDYFLGGTFSSYGTDVINFVETDNEDRVDPMSRIFPKVTKCTFRSYGPSGTIEFHDAFCVLAVNIINEKIFILLWFWLIILSTLTSLHLAYRFCVIMFPPLRKFLLQRRGRWARDNISVIASKCRLGDWFFVYHLGRHMEPYVYGEFLAELAKELDAPSSSGTLERKPMLTH